MDKDWRLMLFGRIRLIDPQGRVIESFPTRRSEQLLARLALARGRSVSRASIADDLWPDDYFDASRLRLRQELARLKKTLADGASFIHAETDTIRLDTARLRLDLDEFSARVREARLNEDPEARLRLLRGACELATEPLLANIDAPWVQRERARHEEVIYASLVELGARLMEREIFSEAFEVAQRAIVLRPDQDEARSIAHKAVAKLASPHVRRELSLTIPHLDKPSQGALQYLVPANAEPIYGREEEVEKILAKLLSPTSPCRLITLIGPGGVGKTRLLTEVCWSAKSAVDDRVLFVDLSESTDVARVPQVVLQSLGVGLPSSGELLERLIELLPSEPFLLALDNLEQFGNAINPVVKRILESCPSARLAVSSRTPLNVAGETRFPVGPLPLPSEGAKPFDLLANPAVQVFMAAADAAGAPPLTDDRTFASIYAIVTRLEGIPLALQLAASRLRALTPYELADRLAGSFDLLSTRYQAIPERQRSIRLVIESSFEALSAANQEAMLQLSIFQGGWTIESAMRVCNVQDALAVMEDLLDASMIYVKHEGRRIRFGMLETVREFARERLDEAHLIRLNRRRAEWMLEVAENIPDWLDPHAAQLLDELDLEEDNLRAATDFALVHSKSLSARFAGHLASYWLYRTNGFAACEFYDALLERYPNVFEGEFSAPASFGVALARCTFPNKEFAPITKQAIEINFRQGFLARATRLCSLLAVCFQHDADYEDSRIALEEAKALLAKVDDPCDRGHLALQEGTIAYFQGFAEHAKGCLSMAVKSFGEAEECFYSLRSRQLLALAALDVRDLDLARSSLTGLIDTASQSRATWFLGRIHSSLGRLALCERRCEDAVAHFQLAYQRCFELKLLWEVAEQRYWLGRTHLLTGDLDLATERFSDAIRSWRRINSLVATCWGLIGLAAVMLAKGERQSAERLMQGTRTICWGGNHRMISSEREFTDALVEELGCFEAWDKEPTVDELIEEFVKGRP